MSRFWQTGWHDIIFVIITILWWAEFRFFRSSGDRTDRDKNKSFKIILASILVSILLSIILTVLSIGMASPGRQNFFRRLGLIIYASGLIIRYWSSYLLGSYFNRNVKVDSDQELVSKGPYRLIRHPLYLGLLLLTAGVPVYMGNILALFLTILLLLPALHYRIMEEEKKMEDILGDKYSRWKKKRKRLIPYLY